MDAPEGSGRVREKEPSQAPVLQGPATAETCEKTIELAATRPLVELVLLAVIPAAAKTLAVLAQELGTDTLQFTVTVGGPAEDRRAINFNASELKLNHPAKLLAVAQTVYSALAEGRSYEAQLTLGFGAAGRAGMREALQRLGDQAADDIRPRARFAKPLGGSS